MNQDSTAQTPETPQTESSNQQIQFPQKIVIVEDEVALAEIYRTRLELIGYQCFIAHEGLEALSLIEKERPTLVLLDIMIPKLAGDRVLQIMRSTDWGKDIRVLIISNLNEADVPSDVRSEGIEGYAVKANLTNDQVDQLVDSILKPPDQEEDINLDTTTTTEISTHK